MSLLNVGDMVYYIRDSMSKCIIDKVTPKYAFIKGTKLHRNTHDDGSIGEVNRDTWARGLYRVASPELDRQYARQLKINNVYILIRTLNNDISMKDLSDSNLDKLYDFLVTITKELKGEQNGQDNTNNT